jgi:hypothetical protein
MAIILSARRRWLIGTAGAMLLAAPALAQQTAPTKTKATEGGITATERLMRDSGLLLRLLAIYEAGGRRLGGGEDIEPIIFTQAAETMRDFVPRLSREAGRGAGLSRASEGRPHGRAGRPS